MTTTIPVVTTPVLPELGYSRTNPAGQNIPLITEVGMTGMMPSSGDIYTIKVTLVALFRGDTAWQLIHDANMFNDPPDPGYEYILIMLRVEYLEGPTADSTYDVSEFWFNVISTNGMEYEQFSIVEPEPDLDADLYPGAYIEGWAAYLISITDSMPLLTIARYYDGTGGIWFKLY